MLLKEYKETKDKMFVINAISLDTGPASVLRKVEVEATVEVIRALVAWVEAWEEEYVTTAMNLVTIVATALILDNRDKVGAVVDTKEGSET